VGDVRTAGATFLTTDSTDLAETFRQPQHGFFLTDGKLCVMGLDKSRKPTIAFWNNSAPTGTMTKQYLELSSGLLLYVYDSATEILYLTVRGSSNITLYDMAKLSTGMPKFSPLSSASLEHGAKGFCFMSKRALNTFQS